MRAHTPGPWQMWTSCSWRRIGSLGSNIICTPITQTDGHPDLHFPNGGFDGPDALLMISAPELLSAAYETVSALRDHFSIPADADDVYIYDEMGSGPAAAYFSAKAAIAKATGAA